MGNLQFCTITSNEYLPYVRVLAEAVARHHPGRRLVAYLCYDLQHEIDPTGEPFDAIWNEDLGLEDAELHRLYLIHGRSFMPAIKAYALDHLVRTTGEPACWLDADLGIFANLDDLGEVIDRHGVLLSPHVRGPIPDDGLAPDDTAILTAGMYNAGLFGVGPKGRWALEFLIDKCRRECVTDTARMRVNEQHWLEFLPSLGEAHVLRDPGVNAAYWNLHERPLREVEGVVHAGEAPLRVFHFSGYDIARPETLTVYNQGRGRIDFPDQPILKRLYDAHRAEVLAAGWRPVETSRAFDELPGGIAVDQRLRQVYRRAVLDAERSGAALPPDAYDPAERPAFLEWANRAAALPSVPPPAGQGAAVANPTAAALPGFPTGGLGGGDVAEALRRLAAATTASMTNLDRRLRRVEAHLS